MGGLASTSTFIVVAIVPANANVHVDVHRRRAPPSTSPPPLHAPILGVRDFGRSISPRLCRASGGRRCVFPRGLGEAALRLWRMGGLTGAGNSIEHGGCPA